MVAANKRWPGAPIYAGLVLAGGKSRRFGSAKARAVFQGSTLLEGAMETLAALTPRLAVSVGDPRTSGVRAWISESWPNVICLDDARPDAGPLAGVEVGMRWAASLPLLVRAVDLPLAGPDVFQRLLDAWRAAVQRVDVVAAETPDGRLQPLLSVWTPDMLPRVSAYLDGGGRSVLGLLDEAHVLRVRVGEQTVKNVNTRDDLT